MNLTEQQAVEIASAQIRTPVRPCGFVACKDGKYEYELSGEWGYPVTHEMRIFNIVFKFSAHRSIMIWHDGTEINITNFVNDYLKEHSTIVDV